MHQAQHCCLVLSKLTGGNSKTRLYECLNPLQCQTFGVGEWDLLKNVAKLRAHALSDCDRAARHTTSAQLNVESLRVSCIAVSTTCIMF